MSRITDAYVTLNPLTSVTRIALRVRFPWRSKRTVLWLKFVFDAEWPSHLMLKRVSVKRLAFNTVIFCFQSETGIFRRVVQFPGGGGTPLYGLYGDVPLDRVWFLTPPALLTGYIISSSSVLNRAWSCPRQGMDARLSSMYLHCFRFRFNKKHYFIWWDRRFRISMR